MGGERAADERQAGAAVALLGCRPAGRSISRQSEASSDRRLRCHRRSRSGRRGRVRHICCELVLNSPSTSASVRMRASSSVTSGSSRDGRATRRRRRMARSVAARDMSSVAVPNGVAVEQQRLCDPQPLQAARRSRSANSFALAARRARCAIDDRAGQRIGILEPMLHFGRGGFAQLACARYQREMSRETEIRPLRTPCLVAERRNRHVPPFGLALGRRAKGFEPAVLAVTGMWRSRRGSTVAPLRATDPTSSCPRPARNRRYPWHSGHCWFMKSSVPSGPITLMQSALWSRIAASMSFDAL